MILESVLPVRSCVRSCVRSFVYHLNRCTSIISLPISCHYQFVLSYCLVDVMALLSIPIVPPAIEDVYDPARFS